ncbi:FAD-dependent oxidoreductase [Pararoseomonas indoligenes]|uniref:FAD-dependent oxidoreductase n=1 Tax=Roseomonas indoligenes TaxID=2820811 RepID=A0A940MZ06_9PROT|nr:FAD-dependent oxidoreductase [Pararoseomonas indoligenes]MBP0494766.1 FAD-dependent oxidoreductase [Pararoseomonas indoligenes]
MPETDIAVIGAGEAGRGIAALARALGLQVTLFERGAMGGEAPDPSIAAAALRGMAARVALMRDSQRFGLGNGPVPVDWLVLRTHLAAADADAAPDSTAARYEAMGVEVVRGAARLSGPDRVGAAGREWRFHRAVIATGALPVVPALEGLEVLPYLTEDTLPSLEERPEHLLVLGGEGFGLEMAQAFARLGAQVTLVSPGPLAPGFDRDMAEGLARALRRDGVTVIDGVEAARAERAGTGLALLLADGRRIEGSHLLLALGRAPRLAGLDLVAAGIAEGPLAVDGGLRVMGNRRIWAAGGVLGRPGGGDIGSVARSMLFRLPSPATAPEPTLAIRTTPALVRLGSTAEPAHRLRWPLADTARGMAEGIGDGLVTLFVDRGGRLSGATLLAPGAEEMAGMLAMGLGRPVSDLGGAALPHPALSAAIARAALEHRAPALANPALRLLAGIAKRLP